MGTINPSPSTTGKALFEGTQSWRGKDDAADNKVGGVYTHVNIEFSATEANEWLGFFIWISWVAKNGGGALQVYNATGATLVAGTPVIPTGWQVNDSNGNPIFSVKKADAVGTNQAMMVLQADLANATSGTAYVGGTVTTAIDTRQYAVGTPVYLAVGGGLTFVDPGLYESRNDVMTQVLGYTETQSSTGVIAFAVQEPRKLGKSALRKGIVDAETLNSGGSPVAAGAASLYVYGTRV